MATLEAVSGNCTKEVPALLSWHAAIFEDGLEGGVSVKDDRGKVVRYGTSLGVDFIKANEPRIEVHVPLSRAGLADTTFSVLQKQRSLGISGALWDCGIFLSHALCSPSLTRLVRGRRVLELGSGTGFVGIVAAALGAKEVVLTDLEAVLPLTRSNVQANQAALEGLGVCADSTVALHPYRWGPREGWRSRDAPSVATLASGFDTVLCADTLYDASQFDNFVHALLTSCGCGRSSEDLSSPSATANSFACDICTGKGKLGGVSTSRLLKKGAGCRSFPRLPTTIVLTYKKRVADRDLRAFRALDLWFRIEVVAPEASEVPEEFRGKGLYLCLIHSRDGNNSTSGCAGGSGDEGGKAGEKGKKRRRPAVQAFEPTWRDVFRPSR